MSLMPRIPHRRGTALRWKASAATELAARCSSSRWPPGVALPITSSARSLPAIRRPPERFPAIWLPRPSPHIWATPPSVPRLRRRQSTRTWKSAEVGSPGSRPRREAARASSSLCTTQTSTSSRRETILERSLLRRPMELRGRQRQRPDGQP